VCNLLQLSILFGKARVKWTDVVFFGKQACRGFAVIPAAVSYISQKVLVTS